MAKIKTKPFLDACGIKPGVYKGEMASIELTEHPDPYYKIVGAKGDIITLPAKMVSELVKDKVGKKVSTAK